MKLKQKRKLKVKTKKLMNSFKYAIDGIIASFKTEKNMKLHILAMILVILLGIIVKLSKLEWIICIILFAIVIAGELFNTAIETTVDIAMPYRNEKAKLAKDVSAGAVLIIALASAIIGGIIFIPKILGIFSL